MQILLPDNITCGVNFDLSQEPAAVTMEFGQGQRLFGSFSLRHDAYPELRYLLILYFYNEFIPVNGKSPHAITLEEYITVYEAMFGCKCVYKDKNASIDHLRSHGLYNRILKDCGLRFTRGGLCDFRQGTPDGMARNAFRSELIACFQREIVRPGQSARMRETLQKRLATLRGFLRTSPAHYLNMEELLEQTLTLEGKTHRLYSAGEPVSWPELIEKHRCIFVSGVCGSGKSTLLKCIALDPDVRSRYEISFKRLVVQPHLFTAGDIVSIEKYKGITHLFLLDGFNELSAEGNVRTKALGSLARLTEYPNVRVIITSTSASGLWLDFALAELGDVSAPDKADFSPNSVMLETPLLYNAYTSAPGVVRERLKNEYQALDYAAKVQQNAVTNEAPAGRNALVYVAYRALLPMLAEMLCLRDALRFTYDDVQKLFQSMKSYGTEENAMLRMCFISTGTDLPGVSRWSEEQMQNAFGCLVENGDIVIAQKFYMFRHQRLRDYYAVSYELKKLKVLLSELPDDFICPQVNLSVSAIELMRQALGIADPSVAVPKEGLLKELVEKLNAFENGKALTAACVKRGYVLAQIYEYIYRFSTKHNSRPLYNTVVRLLGGISDAICRDTAAAKSLLDEAAEANMRGMLAYILCKQADLSIDYVLNDFETIPDTDRLIAPCLRICEAGSEVLGFYPRLMHTKAKAILYASQLKYRSGEKEEAARMLDESLALLNECFARGCFLSGNLRAFMHRTPVTFLMDVKPEIRDPVKGLTVYLSIATDPALHGISPNYARNEAIDSLLMGEVSVKSFSSLNSFMQQLGQPGGAEKLLETGRGRCGKRELRLVRALLDGRGGTLGDTRPFTAFYEFMTDLIECLFELGPEEAPEALSAKHTRRLRQRLQASEQDKVLDLLALLLMDGRDEYGSELLKELSLLAKTMRALAQCETDETGADNDHPYYACQRFLYYYRLLRNELPKVSALGGLSSRAALLSESVAAFEKRFPRMKQDAPSA